MRISDWSSDVCSSDLEEMELLGSLPLQFDPGTSWCYSMSTDVCGAIVEVVSGVPLDEFFEREIFGPLKMPDTSFWVEGDDRCARFTTNHLFFGRSEEHTSELQSLMRISYAVFCLKKKNTQ